MSVLCSVINLLSVIALFIINRQLLSKVKEQHNIILKQDKVIKTLVFANKKVKE